MEGSSSPTPTGLRAFKKARTRLAISDVATRLFIEHGFEHVTVAQIAEAAEVSTKTVFNYFTSKEELFFDRAEDVIGALVDAVVERPAGTTVLRALHGVLADRRVPFDTTGWAALREPEHFEMFRSYIATEHASPALRARRLVIAESWVERLAAAFAAALERPGDLRTRTLAAMVVATLSLRERELSAAMLAREAPGRVERRVRAVVDECFGRLAAAFPDLDAPR